MDQKVSVDMLFHSGGGEELTPGAALLRPKLSSLSSVYGLPGQAAVLGTRWDRTRVHRVRGERESQRATTAHSGPFEN